MIALILATKKEIDPGFSNTTLIGMARLEFRKDISLTLIKWHLFPCFPIGKNSLQIIVPLGPWNHAPTTVVVKGSARLNYKNMML